MLPPTSSVLCALSALFLFSASAAAQATTLPQCALGCAQKESTALHCDISDSRDGLLFPSSAQTSEYDPDGHMLCRSVERLLDPTPRLTATNSFLFVVRLKFRLNFIIHLGIRFSLHIFSFRILVEKYIVISDIVNKRHDSHLRYHLRCPACHDDLHHRAFEHQHQYQRHYPSIISQYLNLATSSSDEFYIDCTGDRAPAPNELISQGQEPLSGAEPGFRALVAQVWVLVARPDIWGPGMRALTFEAILYLVLHAMNIDKREHHDDLVEGCGGTLGDLATLLINFVTHLASDDIPKSLFFMNMAMTIMDRTERLRKRFSQLLLKHGIIRSALPYPLVLRALQPALLDVTTTLDQHLASRSPVWNHWSRFIAESKQFFEVVKLHGLKERVSMRACDNVECEEISSKKDFKTCSRCESVYYCGAYCQRMDWKRGHRQTCASIRSYSLHHPDTLTLRDESFLRSLLHDLYRNLTKEIVRSDLSVIHRDPDIPVVTIIKHQSPDITVHSTTPKDAAFDREFFGPIWDDQLSRVEASGGRMRMHVLVVGGDSEEREYIGRIIPLRIPASQVGILTLSDGLRVLAREVPPWVRNPEELKNLPGFVQKVDALIALVPTGGIH
ncbi:hypothetical protein FB45DRAFT_1034904 [Roridomyces roridus]|uniref:MYND-type domain-containing protein n=1 Tax=Roridomyces roridus TaxID=1738132 RepID=A0AAD7BC08_9AGAR|nr:hypothetical protein FB45DRAFT_1034904 [Roridomyces roridus]